MKSYSSGEVAKMCDVTSRTVIRWIAAGKLHAHKLPGRGNNRVSEADLLHFLSENNIPIPRELAPEEDEYCVVLSADDYTTRNVKRIARAADYDCASYDDCLEAGFEIAEKRPSLIIVDYDENQANPQRLHQRIEQTINYRPFFIILGQMRSSIQKRLNAQHTRVLSKPLELNQLSELLDSLNMTSDPYQ